MFALTFLHVLLIVIFVVSGGSKLLSPQAFKQTVIELRIVDSNRAAFAAHLIVWMELASALMLLHPASFYWGGSAIVSLLLLFSLISIRSIVMKQGAKCNCFGMLASDRIGLATLIKSSIILVLAIAVLVTTTAARLLMTDPGILFLLVLVSVSLVAFYSVVNRLLAYLNKLRDA